MTTITTTAADEVSTGETQSDPTPTEPIPTGREPDPDSGDDSARLFRWRRSLPGRMTTVLMLLLAVAVVLATVFGWKLKTRHDLDVAGEQALTAAQQYATTLTSIDAGHIDSDFAAVLNGATGDFKDMYGQSSDQLKPLLVQAQSVSKGHVVAASIESASSKQVVVMLFVDSAITNVTNPEPRIDRNRIIMTMDLVDGRWLAGKVDLP